MLQQTRMEVVLRYFGPFISRFPNPSALAAADVDEVLALWSGMGYYRRARMLLRGAIHVTRENGGSIPSDPAALRKIPGIGRYTAGAISSIAFDRPAPIVDGNVARILARIFALEEPLRSSHLERQTWQHAEALVAAASSPRAFNQSMMELGATICTPANPDCGRCPVSGHCLAMQSGSPASYPRASARREPLLLSIPLYFVLDDRGCVLMRREEGALMTGMFHLPHGSDALLASSSEAFSPGRRLGSFRHTVTHRRISFELFEAEPKDLLRESPAEFQWVDPRRIDEYPHPSYVRKAFRLALDASR